MSPLINGEEFRFARVRIITTRRLRAGLAEDVTFNATTQRGVVVLPADVTQRDMTQAVFRTVRGSFELILTFGNRRISAREQRFAGCRILPVESPNIFFSFEGLTTHAASPSDEGG